MSLLAREQHSALLFPMPAAHTKLGTVSSMSPALSGAGTPWSSTANSHSCVWTQGAGEQQNSSSCEEEGEP